VFDAKGDLFGTTDGGGNQPCPVSGSGCGTVFELSPPSSQGGAWTETVLYNFCSNNQTFRCGDGALPISQLIFDVHGNLYGTTSTGGTGGSTGGCCAGGTVFELSHSSGGWTETVLYNFCANGGDECPDGTGPQAGVTPDKTGNLYGTTELGGGSGTRGGGTVYKLSPGSSGWTETVLYAFVPPYRHGENPLGTVTFDPQGNLYGTTEYSQNNFGGVFRLSPKGGGNYSAFLFNGSNGANPLAGVLLDSKRGVLYGTTVTAVFQIAGNGQETVLQNLCSNCPNGYESAAGVIEDKTGNLYGTTKLGGINNQGVVFEIIPSSR
jgi:uncharacterized repeat protein (TIGR03803 family)